MDVSVSLSCRFEGIKREWTEAVSGERLKTGGSFAKRVEMSAILAHQWVQVLSERKGGRAIWMGSSLIL